MYHPRARRVGCCCVFRFGSATDIQFLCVSVSVRARAGPSEARLVPEAPPIRTQSEAQERERPVGVSTRRHLTKQQSGP
jgi:hypothetical protein